MISSKLVKATHSCVHILWDTMYDNSLYTNSIKSHANWWLASWSHTNYLHVPRPPVQQANISSHRDNRNPTAVRHLHITKKTWWQTRNQCTIDRRIGAILHNTELIKRHQWYLKFMGLTRKCSLSHNLGTRRSWSTLVQWTHTME